MNDIEMLNNLLLFLFAVFFLWHHFTSFWVCFFLHYFCIIFSFKIFIFNYWMLVSKIPFKSLNNKVQFIFQICFFLGGLNQIAQLCSVLFLLSYASVNLACLGLVLSSAPNFRYVQWGLSFRGFFFYQMLSHRIFCFELFFVSTLNFIYILDLLLNISRGTPAWLD